MIRQPQKVVGVFALVLAVWAVVYWIYDPQGTRVTYDGSEPIQVLPMAGRERQAGGSDVAVRDPMSGGAGKGGAGNAGGAEPNASTQPNVKPSAGGEAGAAPKGPRRVVQKPQFSEIVVGRGDTSFEAISRRVYGDRRHAAAISRANPLVPASKLIAGKTRLLIPLDPTNVQGRVVELPPAKEAEGAKPAAAKPAPTNPGAPKANPPAKPVPDKPDAPKPTGEGAGRTYTVKEGDTLSAVSKAVYGKSALWERIFEANRDQLDSPGKVKPGMVLKIPPAP